MTTPWTTPPRSLGLEHRRSALVLIAGLAGVAVLAGVVGGSGFGLSWRIQVGPVTEDAITWFIESGEWVYQPIGEGATWFLNGLNLGMSLVPDPVMAFAVVAVAWAVAGWRLGSLAGVTMLWVTVSGLWSDALETLALVTVAVIAAAIIGYVLGVVASLSEWVRVPMFWVVDAMQTIPVFVYLLPVVLIFGAGNTAALVVTVIYAVPPILRLTELGLRTAPAGPLEGAASTGATKGQILRDVKMPLAAPVVRIGLNQTIMLAVAMSIIAAMIGASGLGEPVWRSLNRLEFGRALDGGVALVLLAILLDRLSSAKARGDEPITFVGGRSSADLPNLKRRFSVSAGLILVATAIAGVIPQLRFADFDQPVGGVSFSMQGRIEGAIDWLNVHGAVVIDPISDGLVRYGLRPADDFLLWLPWYAVVGVLVILAIVTNGPTKAALFAAGIMAIGLMGMWEDAATTLALVGISTAVALGLGIPLGIAMSSDARVEAAMRPVLDVLQTMPIYVFIIPAVVIMGSGTPAGILATVLYTVAPSARFTCAALRNVPSVTLEAATSVGATDGQKLRTVQFPLGIPTILAGVNQTILLAMSMAVVASLIGAPGLGQTILVALSQLNLAAGVEAGLSMLIMAVIASQMLEGGVRRLRRAEHLA